MNTVINFITANWGIIAIFIGLIAYSFTHQKLAIEYAKKKALEIMFSLEANDEQYILTSGLDKLEFVCLNGYKVLPYLVKRFVTENSFKAIVQDAFDKARAYAEAHKQGLK